MEFWVFLHSFIFHMELAVLGNQSPATKAQSQCGDQGQCTGLRGLESSLFSVTNSPGEHRPFNCPQYN